MKKATLKEYLAKYDDNKGFIRTYVRAEPHIEDLRIFIDGFTRAQEELTPKELLKLARIIIDKKNRQAKESGKTFTDLANLLGGYEALDKLANNQALTPENLSFLEKNASKGSSIATTIIILTRKISLYMPIVLTVSASNTPDDTSKLLTKFLLLKYEESTLGQLFAVITLLNKAGFLAEEYLDLVANAQDIDSIYQILLIIEKSNNALLKFSFVETIFKLKNPSEVAVFLRLIPIEPNSIDTLFAAEGSLPECKDAMKMIKLFQLANWPLEQYLSHLLNPQNHASLYTALEKLQGFATNPFTLLTILDAIFSRSNQSINLVDAAISLSQGGLVQDELMVAFAVDSYSDRVARAIVLLKNEDLYSLANREVICAHPQYAIGLAQIFIELELSKCTSSRVRNLILKYPHCAEMTARAINLLRGHSLDLWTNISALAGGAINHDAFLSLVTSLSEAQLLTQENLDQIFQRLKFIKTLNSACHCLAYAKGLDQFNFESILTEPVNALILAEDLSGKSLSEMEAELDPGARDFVEIRKAAQLLKLAKSQGFFFGLSAEAKLTFEKDTKTSLSDAQDKAFMKILGYLGNQELETSTESHIAASFYY